MTAQIIDSKPVHFQPTVSTETNLKTVVATIPLVRRQQPIPIPVSKPTKK